MARLYDRLMQWDLLSPLANRDHVFDPANIAYFTGKWRGVVKDAVVTECTNVAEQFIDTYITNADPKHTLFRDLKCLVPPFHKMFFEWSQLPSFLAAAGAERMGLCVYGTTKQEAPELIKSVFGNRAHQTPIEIERMSTHPDCHWILTAWDFIQFQRRPDAITPLRGPYNTFSVSVDKEGRFLDLYASFATKAISKRERQEVAASSMIGFLSLAMMNCRNITTRDHVPAERRGHKRRRKGRSTRPSELVTFKTIHVDASAKAPAASKRPHNGGGDPKRRGPVRGHMKRYDGAGLFGKYKGTWYWGPHLRGDAKAGVTVADYTIDMEEKG
jgi:hypothetical protein